jgi:signal transduction histidine kinase
MSETVRAATVAGPRAIAAARYRSAVGDVPDVLELVADICRAPMAALKVAGDTSAHFAATLGMPIAVEVPHSMSLCGMVCSADDTMVVDDPAHDPRVATHPLVAGPAHVNFLAAAPLHHEGHIVGALCVFDTAPRSIDADTTRRYLERLARRIDRETGLRDQLTRQQAFPALVDQDEVVTAISHELRTPLSAIQGNIELLAELSGAGGGLDAGRMDAVVRNAERLGRTADHLLRAITMTRHEPLGRPAGVDLGALVASVVARLGNAAPQLVLNLPARPVTVLADERLLTLAITNLLSNALLHGRSDRPATVTVSNGPFPQVEISDHGPGLDETELSRLGLAFFRGAQARRQETPGLGLGIAVTRRIVDAQGGCLRLDSSPGEGLTACLSLPAAV